MTHPEFDLESQITKVLGDLSRIVEAYDEKFPTEPSLKDCMTMLHPNERYPTSYSLSRYTDVFQWAPDEYAVAEIFEILFNRLLININTIAETQNETLNKKFLSVLSDCNINLSRLVSPTGRNIASALLSYSDDLSFVPQWVLDNGVEFVDSADKDNETVIDYWLDWYNNENESDILFDFLKSHIPPNQWEKAIKNSRHFKNYVTRWNEYSDSDQQTTEGGNKNKEKSVLSVFSQMTFSKELKRERHQKVVSFVQKIKLEEELSGIVSLKARVRKM